MNERNMLDMNRIQSESRTIRKAMNFYVLQKHVWLFMFVLLNLVFFNTAHATKKEVTTIFQQLSAAPIVRAQFQQQKKLADLNKTFVSNGSVVFSKQQGVLWQIEKPVQASLVVTPEKLVQKTQRTMSQVDMAKSPYGSVANMFLQLMSGNEAALAKNFNVVSASYTANQWSLTLVPKSALFKKLFVQVNAQGQRYVDQIVITEKANNSTTIRFQQHSTQPTTLTASENELFKLAK